MDRFERGHMITLKEAQRALEAKEGRLPDVLDKRLGVRRFKYAGKTHVFVDDILKKAKHFSTQ